MYRLIQRLGIKQNYSKHVKDNMFLQLKPRAVSTLSPPVSLLSVKLVSLPAQKFLIERFSLDCRKTNTKVNKLANQRA